MFEQAFKNIDDVLRKEAGCTTELDYTEQTSWLLFLKYLDGLEQDLADEAALAKKKYSYILDRPYRWETWAAPKGKDGKLDHNLSARAVVSCASAEDAKQESARAAAMDERKRWKARVTLLITRRVRKSPAC
jgi:HsdM N-terminal domain